jgi:hypothetical protein
MATILETTKDWAGGNLSFNWTGLANGDDGRPVYHAATGDKSVQISGTFGVGGNVLVEGSLDAVNWQTLHDPQGVALTFSSAGLRAVLENVVAIRPKVSAGDGSTNINATMIVRR